MHDFGKNKSQCLRPKPWQVYQMNPKPVKMIDALKSNFFVLILMFEFLKNKLVVLPMLPPFLLKCYMKHTQLFRDEIIFSNGHLTLLTTQHAYKRSSHHVLRHPSLNRWIMHQTGTCKPPKKSILLGVPSFFTRKYSLSTLRVQKGKLLNVLRL